MRHLLILVLATTIIPLAALDVGDAAPVLGSGVTMIKGEAPAAVSGDQVSVVEFWATWCPPCVKSIPHLSELQAKHPGVQFIGLSDEDEATVRPFVEAKGAAMAYRVGLVDQATRTAYMDGVPGIPHAFIVGKGGKVLWHGHPMEMDQPLADIVAGTFDADRAAKISGLEDRLQKSLQGRQPDLAAAKKLIADLLALNPVHDRALGIGIRIHEHEENVKGLRDFLEAIPVDRLSAAQANELAWNRAVAEDLRTRNLDLALRFAEHALALDEDAAILDTRARVHYAMGRLDLAIADQERASTLDPQFAETLAAYRQISTVAQGLAPATPAPAVPAVMP